MTTLTATAEQARTLLLTWGHGLHEALVPPFVPGELAIPGRGTPGTPATTTTLTATPESVGNL